VDKRPLRVGLVLLLAALALTAMLLTACGGGGDDHAKVEASLRHYVSTLHPQACLDSAFCQQGVFPLGAGVPQVRENSCKKIHTGPLRAPRNPKGLSAWSCVITFAHGKTALPVAVAVKGSGEVYSAVPVSQAAPLPPATVYEGGP
jgi:hypothetical protein